MPSTTASSAPTSDAHWPVFVVNLPDMADRRAAILKQCRAVGIEPIVIDAIDGRKSLPPEYEPLVDRAAMQASTGRETTDAECACALTHQSIYQRILDDNLPGAIVLEDDAILTPLFTTFYRAQGYTTADFIQMDHNRGRARRFGHIKWSNDLSLLPLAANAYRTSGYSITRKTAQFLRDNATPLAGVADWPCDMQPMHPLATMPRIVQSPPEADPGSTIEPGRDIKIREQYERDHPLMQNNRRAGQSPLRILRRSYWKRFWLKHFCIHIS